MAEIPSSTPIEGNILLLIVFFSGRQASDAIIANFVCPCEQWCNSSPKVISFLYFAVTKSFDTGLESISPVYVLHDGSIVFHAYEQGQAKLKSYNIDTGTEISCADIPDVPLGSCLVELGGRSSLALSFR